MKKRRLVFSIVLIILCCTACGPKHAAPKAPAAEAHAATEAALEEEAIAEAPIETASETALEEEVIAEAQIETITVEESTVTDSYDVLSMKKSYIDGLKAAGGYVYLLRDNKYYSLGMYMGKDKTEMYQVGWDYNAVDFQNRAYSGGEGRLQAIGNIPVVTITTDDTIIGIGATLLKLIPVEKKGYTIRRELFVWPEYYSTLIPSPTERVDVDMMHVKQFTLADSSGKERPLIEESYNGSKYSHPDFDNLIENETYTASWFEGTDYHECTMVADSPYYEDVQGEEYKLEGELHKEGYASFDLSNIPKGLYRTGIFRGIIRIE